MKEYEIVKETVTPGYFLDEKQKDGSVERKFIKTGKNLDKWNICYYDDGKLIDKAFFSYDGINPVGNYKITEGFYERGTGKISVEKIPVSKLDIDSIIAELEKRYDLTPKK